MKSSLQNITIKALISNCDDIDELVLIQQITSKRLNLLKNRKKIIEFNRWNNEMRQLSSNTVVSSDIDGWKRKHGQIDYAVFIYNKQTNKKFTFVPLEQIIFVFYNWQICFKLDYFNPNKSIKIITNKLEFSKNDAEHLFYMFFSRK